MTAPVNVATPAPYATLAALKSLLGGSSRAVTDDDQLSSSLLAATAGIDLAAGRTYQPASTDLEDATPRFYQPDHPKRLEIGDCTAIAELATDQTGQGTYSQLWVANRDFFTQPENAIAEGYPIERIRQGPYTRFLFYPRPMMVRVTALWGWPATPPNVSEMCLILAAKIFKRKKEAPLGIAVFGAETAMRLALTDPMWPILMGSQTSRIIRDPILG